LKTNGKFILRTFSSIPRKSPIFTPLLRQQTQMGRKFKYYKPQTNNQLCLSRTPECTSPRNPSRAKKWPSDRCQHAGELNQIHEEHENEDYENQMHLINIFTDSTIISVSKPRLGESN
jgi:hypothetical protein